MRRLGPISDTPDSFPAPGSLALSPVPPSSRPTLAAARQRFGEARNPDDRVAQQPGDRYIAPVGGAPAFIFSARAPYGISIGIDWILLSRPAPSGPATTLVALSLANAQFAVRGSASAEPPYRWTVTRRKVAGIEVAPSLLFCALNKASSSDWSSASRPSAAAASNAFMVGP